MSTKINFWVRRPPGGVGVFHAKGWESKSSRPPSKVCLPWVSKGGTWDPGNFARMSQTPGCVQKVCAKNVCAHFWAQLFKAQLGEPFLGISIFPFHDFSFFHICSFFVKPALKKKENLKDQIRHLRAQTGT